MNSITRPLLAEIEKSDSARSETLFAELYAELHKMAKRQLARQSGGLTLSPTTLLHQTYIDLAGSTGTSFPDNSRFLAYAARVMRGLIIDHSRHRRVQKRGGHFEFTRLDNDAAAEYPDSRELSQIGEALDELERVNASLAELVDLKFFCGFTFAEIAAMRNISERTVQRDWEKARLYLYRSIRPELL